MTEGAYHSEFRAADFSSGLHDFPPETNPSEGPTSKLLGAADPLKLFSYWRLIRRRNLSYGIGSCPAAPMTAARKLPPLMTVDDFLCWEGDGTDTRYELIDGVLRAMAPTVNTHGIICTNLIYALSSHLRGLGSRCMVVTAPGIRPAMRADWNFRMPDLGVTCESDRKGERIVAEPILLIEVLSPSNSADTYENIRAYATLPSVAELLVMHSTRIEAELFRKAEGNIWPANPVIANSCNLSLASINLTLPAGGSLCRDAFGGVRQGRVYNGAGTVGCSSQRFAPRRDGGI